MRNRELVKLKGMLSKLTRGQRKALATELAGLESKAASIEIVESQAPARRCARTARLAKSSRTDRPTASSGSSAAGV